MTVILDQKDLTQIDDEHKADSQVWDILGGGANNITAADFVGAQEVRLNKMSGFVQPSQYNRNGKNTRAQISVAKETFKLSHEDWMGYDVDRQDESENLALTTANIVERHRSLISIPRRDKVAVQVMYDRSTKKVSGSMDTKTALSAYDDAEAYMADAEVSGGFVMFASSGYYKLLKNADGVSKTFTVNEMSMNGINRNVAQLDGGIPIVRVAKDRLAGLSITDNIAFILVPLYAVAPVLKVNTVDLIPAESDRDGYRDTIKGLDYFDAFVFDNAQDTIYIATDSSTPASGSSTPASGSTSGTGK